jgi:tRNA G37 N-methylase Trm5
MSDSMPKDKPHDTLNFMISEYLLSNGIDGEKIDDFIIDIPKKWEKFSDVILLPNSSFEEKKWDNHRTELWNIIVQALGAKKLGIMGEIKGEKRESTVKMLLGEDDWVIRRENGIKYGYRFTKCMFSSGNINERMRMGGVGKLDEVVVDLYAGIGYYSLPILVFSKIKHLHSFEWNPESVRALEINLQSNGVTNRCSIHLGDNKITTNKFNNIADRVILGLLPSAKGGYIPALNVLKDSGVLHIHGIAQSKNHDEWIKKTLTEINLIRPQATISEISRFKIKSYAPHWDHIVLDVKVE